MSTRRPVGGASKYSIKLHIPLPLAVKLGSIAVHAQELVSPAGHPLDRVALESLLTDPEVKEWLKGMSEDALLPLPRTVRQT